MTNEEAQSVEIGDTLYVNTLEIKVTGIKRWFNDVFFSSDYGEFNASVCVPALTDLPGEDKR